MKGLVLGIILALLWPAGVTSANTPCVPCVEADLLKIKQELVAERDRLKRKRELKAVDAQIKKLAEAQIKKIENKFRLTFSLTQGILNGPGVGASAPIGPLTLKTGFYTYRSDVSERGYYLTLNYAWQWAPF